MYTVRTIADFSAAHRLEGHPKCGRMHGHNYHIEIVVEAEDTHNGMVIDFGNLKPLVAGIVDPLDHRYLVSIENIAHDCPYFDAAPDDDYYLLPFERSTAELLAKYIYDELNKVLPSGAWSKEIRVWETPKHFAGFAKKGSFNVSLSPEDIKIITDILKEEEDDDGDD